MGVVIGILFVINKLAQVGFVKLFELVVLPSGTLVLLRLMTIPFLNSFLREINQRIQEKAFVLILIFFLKRIVWNYLFLTQRKQRLHLNPFSLMLFNSDVVKGN